MRRAAKNHLHVCVRHPHLDALKPLFQGSAIWTRGKQISSQTHQDQAKEYQAQA
jgi:hypothetical protein